MKKNTIKEILNIVSQKRGITFDTKNQSEYQGKGFVVSIYPENEKVIKNLDEFSIIYYNEQHKQILNEKDHYFGIWYDNNLFYLDIVVVVEDLELAKDLAKKHNQKAIFDLNNNQEVWISKI